MKKNEVFLTKPFLKKFGLVLVVAVFLIFFVGSANAGCVGESGKYFGCGDTITESCTFDEDLSCPAGHGLIIGANGITIEGAGFKMTGSEAADACEWVIGITPKNGDCGILNKGYDNVVIENLEIENFCTGIGLQGEGQNPVVNNIIDNCEVHDNGNATCSSDTSIHGIHACYVSECTMSNNRIHHNTGAGDSCEAGGNGIFLYAGSASYKNNVIANNEIYENRKSGFFTKKMLHHARITDNHIYGNGQGGIVLRCKLSNYNLIEGNNVSCNYGDGIFIGGQNNTVRNNVVKNNIAGFKITPRDVIGDGDGIDMGRSRESENNELISNEVCGNEGADIEVTEGCSGNHGSDNTCDTTSNYNDKGTTGCTYAYRAAEQPTPTPTATTTSLPISTPTPGFEAGLALIALIIVTLSFFFKERTKPLQGLRGRGAEPHSAKKENRGGSEKKKKR